MNLLHKVILITWASDWIGKEITLRVAKEQAIVVCLARNEKKLEAVCKEAKENWAAETHWYTCDISINQQIEETISRILHDLSREICLSDYNLIKKAKLL